MSRAGLAGSLLLSRVRGYYRDLANRRFSDEKGALRREFIKWAMGNPGFSSSLSESLEVAASHVDNIHGTLQSMGYTTLKIWFRLLGPGLVGAGEGIFKTVFEVGMTVDPLLGLPYYPGSTLKGAARSACYAIVEAYKPRGSDRPYYELCDMLFGSKSSAGIIVFTPAYPVGCLKGARCMVYVGDIVTPHYYSGGEPVESELEATPNPVAHLAIGKDLVFSTVIASRHANWPKTLDFSRVDSKLSQIVRTGPLHMAKTVLLSSLIHGFAARSGKGYNVAEPLSPEILSRIDRSLVRVSFRTTG